MVDEGISVGKEGAKVKLASMDGTAVDAGSDVGCSTT